MKLFKNKKRKLIILRKDDSTLTYNGLTKEQAEQYLEQINNNLNEGTKFTFIGKQMIIPTDSIKEAYQTNHYN